MVLVAVFKPVFASAKMCINPNAELELKTPKANLYLEVQDIAIELTKPQVTSHTYTTNQTPGNQPHIHN